MDGHSINSHRRALSLGVGNRTPAVSPVSHVPKATGDGRTAVSSSMASSFMEISTTESSVFPTTFRSQSALGVQNDLKKAVFRLHEHLKVRKSPK